MMKLGYFFIGVFIVALSANRLGHATSETIQLETTRREFTAGETITLAFSGLQDTSVMLYCSNSYGATLLAPNIVQHQLQYTIPKPINTKTGVVQWKLVYKKALLSGTFTVVPQKLPKTLETYVGPPSIAVGKKDVTMVVAIPTDALDNPLKAQTKVTVKRQFQSSQVENIVKTKNYIAYQNSYAPTESGRMLLATECMELQSQEFTVTVMPGVSENFQIFAKRAHSYADGNQMTTFTTSVIKDAYTNVVSDGSFVTFIITDKNGNMLKTFGTTLNGVATAQMIHPDEEETWRVQAFVAGISESNTLSLYYKKAIENFAVSFSENHRTITVGPLQSFMKQHIPDGLQVTLQIVQNGKLVDTMYEESRDGYVNFELNPNIYSNGYYDFKIKAAGIEKTFQTKKLW